MYNCQCCSQGQNLKAKAKAWTLEAKAGPSRPRTQKLCSMILDAYANDHRCILFTRYLICHYCAVNPHAVKNEGGRWGGTLPHRRLFLLPFPIHLQFVDASWRFFLNMNWLQDGALRLYLSPSRNPKWRLENRMLWNQHSVVLLVAQLQMKFQRIPPHFAYCRLSHDTADDMVRDWWSFGNQNGGHENRKRK